MTLEECISYANQHNLQLQQSDIAIQQAQLNQKQAKWAVAPSVNGNIRHGVNVGRTVDLTSYDFVNQTNQSSGWSLSLNVPIYQGGQLKNSILQSKTDVQASKQDKAQQQRNLALNIAQGYLTVLLAQESYEVLNAQIKVTRAQYEQTLKLIKAGTLPENNRYDLEAQIARDEQNIINAKNSIANAYLALKTVMNFPINSSLTISPIEDLSFPQLNLNEDIENIYKEAQQQQPNLIAAKLRIESAKIAKKIADGALHPSLSFYNNLSSNFSSAAKEISGFDTTYTTLPVTAGGSSIDFSIPNIRPIQGNTVPYFKQLSNNMYFTAGVNLTVPIFNGFRARINQQRASLGIKAAELNKIVLENALKSDLVRAVNDAKAAQKRYDAATKTLQATERAVENTRKRYKIGVVNAFELTSAQTTLINTKSNLLQAKYDLVFKLKIVDFYTNSSINIK